MNVNPEQLKMLGLPPDATDDEVSERIAGLGAAALERDTLTTKLEAKTVACKANEDALAEITAAAQTQRSEALELSARSAGKFAPGDALHQQFQRLVKLDVAEAEAFVAALPTNGATQVGAPSLSSSVLPAMGAQIATGVDRLLSEEYGVDSVVAPIFKHAFAQLGITEKQVADFGPAAIRKKQELNRDDWSAGLRGMAVA